MADIHSPTAENWRGKKTKKKVTTAAKYLTACPILLGGHKKTSVKTAAMSEVDGMSRI